VVQLVVHCTQAGFNVSQTFSVGKLSEGHAKKLIKAREPFDVMVALIPIYAFLKLSHREKVHQLGEYKSS
jgi:hypothetical protein